MNSGRGRFGSIRAVHFRSDRFLEQPEHLGRLEAAVGMDAVTLAGGLVNQVEHR